MKVAVIDDHPPIAHGVMRALSTMRPDIVVVGYRSVSEFLEATASCDVVLLDVNLNDQTQPRDNVQALVSNGYATLLYTQEVRKPVIAECLSVGASGIVGKHEELEVLSEALECVAQGEPYLSTDWAAVLESPRGIEKPALTERESEALMLYATGLPLKSVARRMGIGDETAREFLKRVRAKYLRVGRAANTKTELLQRAIEDGRL